MKRLENKTALVTGGSRGMGAAIVKRLAAEGATVAFTHSGSAPENVKAVTAAIEQYGGRALAIQADAADAGAVASAIDRAAAELGRLNILVNNAGIGLLNTIDALTIEDFDRVMAVNVRAVFAGIKAALPHMPAGGRIITIGSNMAERVAMPGGSLYAMSKSALIGLTKGVAREAGAKGITVNLVQPGPVDTDMNPANGPFAATQHSYMALPRHAHADEIASLVAYLCGEESGFITGASLTIDGGFNI